MEGEMVVPAMFLHSARFHDAAPPLGKKRDLPWLNPAFCHALQPPQHNPGPNSNWNPSMWGWDSVGFTAKPSSDASGAFSRGTRANSGETDGSKGDEALKGSAKGLEGDGVNLTLKLGVGASAAAVRPSKRVRSGSPGGGGGGGGGNGGGGGGPMCQVDDCRADLSGAKDYHRRHKVCELHSKMTQVLVRKVMQRFCQQCSRFHPLSEFDEGKRSCRRRLAGHNRRRRKAQPEDASSLLALPGFQENVANGSMDIANLLVMLTRLQDKNGSKPASTPSQPDKDLIQMLSKIHPLLAAKSLPRSPVSGGFDLNVPQASQQGSFEELSITNGNPTAPSKKDLLAVLSAAHAAFQPGNHASPSQGGRDNSGNDKTRITSVDPAAAAAAAAADVNLHNKSTQILSLIRERSSCTNQSLSEEAPIQEARVRLPLQLFGSAEDDIPPKLESSVKYLSSESSNPMEDRSPLSSPPVPQALFPVHSAEERRYERMSTCRADNPEAEASTSCGWSTPVQPFMGSDRRVGSNSIQNRISQAGYASSSASDHSPSSSISAVQDRTGRITFKLFDKDPSNLPPGLRSQISHWLSNSPSEMESYIRPGCVMLSIYLSMPSIAWEELEEDLLQRVNSLVQCSDSNFWKNGRFLVRTSRQLASHKGGKIHLCKSWRAWSAPELTSVSPIAVVSGKETSIILRGRNLTVPGTKIHCTYMGGYTSKEVLGSTYPGTIYDDSSLESFIFPGGSPDVLGRCFIEVENGFKGNSFPVIIADATICQELRVLESEFEEDLGTADVILEDQILNNESPRSRENVLHFLNELGWLFQKKTIPCSPPAMDFSSTRFKFLFIFSVERDWSALTKMILDILVERSIESDVLSLEALEMLSETQLLSRAVKRKCRKMVDLLLHYSARRGPDASKVYLFPPNQAGLSGLTPLHLAASLQDSEDMVDALTNDPQEIGLNCWNSIRDDNGQTPYLYALMRRNHSYNRVVARKLADRANGHVSITVGKKTISLDNTRISEEAADKPIAQSLQAGSCGRCAVMEARRVRRIVRTRGLLQRPYVHSMLAIAAVCVCVCLFFRGMPQIGSVAPFKWENLDYGPS